MASINKLSVRGIRSFSAEADEQVVEFYFPCTVIVGANGCGKTTIIESLKYAVTGSLPPGSRSGQAFVHDTKAAQRQIVKGQIKLRFTSRNGQEMVVSRSMELQQKKTTVSFKQLDGVIRTLDPNTGERVSLSHKCSELDKQLPIFFGVSKPILEHVLFCHQEDSSWPLQEGAVLKKRFDDIFDSTRYSKALEVFRKTEKDLISKSKDLKGDLNGYKSHKHAAQTYRKELDEQNEQLDSLDDEKKELSKRITNIESIISECSEIISQIEDMDNHIDRSKNQLSQEQHVIDKQYEMLEKDLITKRRKQLQKESNTANTASTTTTTTIDHSIMSDLKDELRDFDQQFRSQQDTLMDLESDYKRYTTDLEQLRCEETNLQSSLGKYTAEKEAHETRIKERYERMEFIANTYEVDLQITQTQQQQQSQQQINTSIVAAGGASQQQHTQQQQVAASQESPPRNDNANNNTQETNKSTAAVAAAHAGDGGGASSSTSSGLMNISQEEMDSFLRQLEKKEHVLKEKIKIHKEHTQQQEDNVQKTLMDVGGKLRSIETDRARLNDEKSSIQREQSKLTKEVLGHSRIRKGDIEENKKKAAQAATRRDQLNNDPLRTSIPIEIRQCEEKIDKIKRSIDDDRITLETLRHSADAQNSIAVLQEQCAKDVEQLEEGLREQSFTLHKLGIKLPQPLELPRDGDDQGDQLVETIEKIIDDARNKYTTANDRLSRATDDANKTQRVVSEKAAVLASSQQNLAQARTRMEVLVGNGGGGNGNDNNNGGGSVAHVRKTVESIRQHYKDTGRTADEADTLSAEKPRELLTFLDEQIAIVEEDAPVTNLQEVLPKIMKRFKKVAKADVADDGNLVCPCCLRKMDDDVLKVFQNQLKILGTHPELTDWNQSKIDEYYQAKDQLQEWRKGISTRIDHVRDFYRISNESVEYEKDISRLKDELVQHRTLLHDQQTIVTNARTEVDEIRDIVDISKRWNDDAVRIAEKRMQINQKRLDLTASTIDSSRDLRTVEREMTELMEEKDTLTNKINRLNRDMTSINTQISQASTQASRLEQLVRDKEEKYAAEQKAAERKVELHERLQKITEEEKKFLDQIAPLRQKQRVKETEKQRLRAHANEEEQSLVEVLNVFNSDVKQLRDLVFKIEEYCNSNKPEELDKINAKVAKLVERIEVRKEEIRLLEPEVEAARAKVKDKERHKKQLKENIQLLEGNKRVEELKREIDRLQEERDNIRGHETAYDKHSEAAEKKAKLLAKKAQIEGRWFEIVEHVRALKRKLSQPEYKNVDEQFRVTQIKWETTQMAAEDLKKYASALDNALLQFHGKKIADINKIVRDLWMLTYKGEDIGNIEIVSGQEPGSRAQKSYNYRVVMTKGSSQMDMRGRCSAGQRVLASIVIRLALAETFGVNCGCIALDEPTVNLDYRNKKGLAVALAQIVASRAQQRNFQLILITHDEEFVGMMKNELSSLTGFSMPEKYFQVRREQGPDGKYYSKINAVDWDELD